MPPRYRVFHVAPSLDIGGLERMIVDFARHHDRTAFDPVFVSITERGVLGPQIEATGAPLIALRKPDGLAPRLILDLARRFRTSGADIVHTHNNAALLYAASAARLARVRCIVHTRHGVEPESARLAGAMPRLLTLAHRVVCVSDDNARAARAAGVAERRVTTILNGVDLQRFAATGPSAEGPIVAVGRLSPEKDQATLLRAMRLLVDTDPALRLEIAGDGACHDDLLQLRSELRLEQNVTFLGSVGDIPAVLRRARMFVLPSLTEGVSLTLLEAMAHGLPVVATAVGGNGEVVVPDETGLLVAPRRPDLFAAAIRTLLQDRSRATTLGKAGRLRVETRFDLRRTVADYEALYVAIHAGRTAINQPPAPATRRE